MTSSNNWICDGVPKDGKDYSGLGGAHSHHENYSLDCEICGLPKESSNPSSNKDSTKLLKIVAPVAAAILVTVLGGGAVYYNLVINRCQPGLEKIDGQCIDPFWQTYQEAIQQGNQAIALLNQYQNLEELEQAQTIIANAINQLIQIPTEARIYSEVKTRLEEYKQKEAEINSHLARENLAQQKLAAISSIVDIAQEQTTTAKNISQLKTAKQKWSEAKNKLEEIDTNTLIINLIEQYRFDYDRQIKNIDERISSIAKRNHHTSNKKAYVPPVHTRKTAPKPKIRKTVSQPKNRIIPKQPKAINSDPCAIIPQPLNCRF